MKKRLFALCCAVLLLLGGCAAPKDTEEKTLVASFYPVYVIAQNVVEGVKGVQVKSLTAPATGCLHDYQLLTSDMKTLNDADALLINGAGMEMGFLGQVTDSFPELPVVDCSQKLILLEEKHGDHHHPNPHVWLDPVNAAQMALTMAEDLGKILPEHQEAFEKNARAYAAKLEELNEKMKAGIEKLPKKDVVTFHEAFPYFAKTYGLNVVAVVALEPDEGVSPKMMSELVEKVKAAGNPPLFTEPQYASDAAKVLSQETGAEIFELDPLVTGSGDKDSYIQGMEKNLSVLEKALSK